jgi:hypothetical protein
MIVNVSGTTSNNMTILGEEISIWPLPADDILNLSSEAPIKTISIFDITGRRVLMQKNLSTDNINLDISALKSGSYIIEAESEDWIVRKKAIIQ